MMTYSITLEGLFRKTVIKNVKGHVFPKDIPNHIMYVVLDNEEKIFINLNKYKQVKLSKELFIIQAKKAEEESNGQAKIIKT